ncbi:hypothetical protein XBI1_1420022 [Xenorhabdus bovienii str. Intermedium]|uniref:Uncharacterized protein n=1 Tax=Xenorhabdus bovienii str. Intermedium TaxID=1379677 RepID=A0A077QCZ2_XENBV|nr:hypothetical protein XBI1_1420022 [Xenorhabdus bovienii str. Intermedium]
MGTEEHFDEIIPLIITFLSNSNDNYYQIAQCLISFASDFSLS